MGRLLVAKTLRSLCKTSTVELVVLCRFALQTQTRRADAQQCCSAVTCMLVESSCRITNTCVISEDHQAPRFGGAFCVDRTDLGFIGNPGPARFSLPLPAASVRQTQVRLYPTPTCHGTTQSSPASAQGFSSQKGRQHGGLSGGTLLLLSGS